MLNVKLICVGRLKEKYYTEAFEEYQKRLGRYCSFSLCELQESGDLEKEGNAILSKIPSGSLVIALCIEGKLFSSESLADYIKLKTVNGTSTICFIIGSSTGLSENIKKSASLRLSMSPMTFPHHLARVMVMEQIYRAFTIIEGGKYHK